MSHLITVPVVLWLLVATPQLAWAQLLPYPSSPSTSGECLRISVKNSEIVQSYPGKEYQRLVVLDDEGFAKCVRTLNESSKKKKSMSANPDADDKHSGRVNESFSVAKSASDLRSQVGQAKSFVKNPAAAIVQQGLSQMQQGTLDAAYGGPPTTGDAKLDYVHERERDIIDNSKMNEVAKSVATASSEQLQRQQSRIVIPLQGLDSQLQSFATPTPSGTSGTRIALRGTLDAPPSYASLPTNTVSADSVPYEAPVRYVDPDTQAVLVIPPGFTLYRARLGESLSVVSLSGSSSPAGDDPVNGQCSAAGIGRITQVCEAQRRRSR